MKPLIVIFKQCPGCKEEKPADSFKADLGNGKFIKTELCPDCFNRRPTKAQVDSWISGTAKKVL